jgi:NAD(P)-dependent dehydrogenase (short-subunit alcohol dehydrogenase family)
MTEQNVKNVLITGASSGIGKAAAQRFLDEGWAVYAVARRLEKMQDLAERGATVMAGDVTRPEEMQAVVAAIEEKHGAVNVLVNNAGYSESGAVEDVPMEDARDQMEVNVFGLIRLCQFVLPGMRRQRSGRIINVSSIVGKITFPASGWYSATKHALEALSDALRFEVAPFGIDVVLVEPGAIRTEFQQVAVRAVAENSKEGPYANLADVYTRMLESRSGDRTPGPEVVANVIYKAASAKRPRTRYPVPFSARLFILLRKLIPDRLWDRLARTQFR